MHTSCYVHTCTVLSERGFWQADVKPFSPVANAATSSCPSWAWPVNWRGLVKQERTTKLAARCCFPTEKEMVLSCFGVSVTTDQTNLQIGGGCDRRGANDTPLPPDPRGWSTFHTRLHEIWHAPKIGKSQSIFSKEENNHKRRLRDKNLLVRMVLLSQISPQLSTA